MYVKRRIFFIFWSLKLGPFASMSGVSGFPPPPSPSFLTKTSQKLFDFLCGTRPEHWTGRERGRREETIGDFEKATFK